MFPYPVLRKIWPDQLPFNLSNHIAPYLFIKPFLFIKLYKPFHIHFPKSLVNHCIYMQLYPKAAFWINPFLSFQIMNLFVELAKAQNLCLLIVSKAWCVWLVYRLALSLVLLCVCKLCTSVFLLCARVNVTKKFLIKVEI